MQICEYPIQVTIHDDCSTDRTREVIRSEMACSPHKWELIVPKTNQFSKRINILNKLIFSMNEDFISIVEGDDYWTDPYKLQKQADKLKADENANLCHHTFNVSKNNEILYEWPPVNWRSDLPGEKLSEENFIGTLTVMLRRSAFKELIPKNYKSLKIGDYHIWALLNQNSKILFIDEVMATYRVHDSNYYVNLDELDKLGYIIQSKIFTALNVSAGQFELWFESIASDLVNLDSKMSSGLKFKDPIFKQELDLEIKKLLSRMRKFRLLRFLLRRHIVG
jgi:glycosyltransferase involved in cell wall biosynthesis